MDSVVDTALNGWRARMHDMSHFAKTFKELVNISYKAFIRTSAESDNPDYCGSVWSRRFKSTPVEGGRCLATCIHYVELNPVRAGMASQARNYAYSSANEPKPNEINGFAGSVPSGGVCVARVEKGGVKFVATQSYLVFAPSAAMRKD